MRKIGGYIMKGLLALLAALPLKVHYRLAGFIAGLASSVMRYRVDDVMINLSRSFPEKNAYELRDLKKAFYRHFGNIIAEAVWFGGCRNPERLRKSRIVELVNPQCLNDLYADSPSVVVLYSHTGNWELLGGTMAYNFTDSPFCINEGNYCVVYRELSSRMWDWIMRDNRSAPLADKKNFSGYIESKVLVRYAYSHRGEKKIYNVNTDQRPYFPGPDYLKVNFLNQECQTMSAAAALAHKFGFAVAYQRMMEKPDGHGYYLEYVPISADGSGMSVEDIMKRYYELLEEDIKAQPHNYLWTHRRWVQV